MTPCDDWLTAATALIQHDQRSYLALDDGHHQLIGQATGAPSQFFRRCLATWLGADSGEWDWLTFPQIPRVHAMINKGLNQPIFRLPETTSGA